MLKKIVFGLAIFLACVFTAGLYYAYQSANSTPVANGSQVVIDSGGHHIEGTLRPSATYQYLLKDEGVSMGTFSGDAFITMLPLETADKLKAKYGDFFHCNDPGAMQAIQSLDTAILVGADAETRTGIAGALALVRRSQIPAVSFTAASLQVTRHTYMNMDVHDNTGIPIYYLTNFTILQEDYLEGIE
jgi:hypothetical protein